MSVSAPILATSATVFVAAAGWLVVGLRQAREKRLTQYAEWLASAINLRQCIKRVGLHGVGTQAYEQDVRQWFALWDHYNQQTNLVRLIGSRRVIVSLEDVDTEIKLLSRRAGEDRARPGLPVWQNTSGRREEPDSWTTCSARSEQALRAVIVAMRGPFRRRLPVTF